MLERLTGGATSARRRAAIEMVARYEHALKRTARRYSLDAEDVEDAYQRALEIVLTKAPTTDPGELIRWTQTVIKHEALAVRRHRERLLGPAWRRDREGSHDDPVALLPARGDGPDEEAERREDVARVREALQTLKPAELRALTLLAEGYSYAEIADITGFSMTKINRSLAEGRERFRSVLYSAESGDRCRELRPLLSAFCDGEASQADAAVVREHLRACASCRATMRAYRTAPRLAAALVPVLPTPPGLFSRARELFAGLGSRAGAVKHLVLGAGVAGAGAGVVLTGALPGALGLHRDRMAPAPIERPAGQVPARPQRTAGSPAKRGKPEPERARRRDGESASPPAEAQAPEPVEYEPPAAPAPEPVAPPPPATEASAASGSAAGEFGP